MKKPVPGKRPGTFIVHFRGFPFEMNTQICLRAMVDRQLEGDLDSLEGLAAKIGISRSTVSRFLSGHQTSLRCTLMILGVLKLRFEDVVKPVELGPNGGPP